MSCEGVLEVTEDHFWQFTDDKLVSSLVLKVTPLSITAPSYSSRTNPQFGV
jgi:hypothetical protein